MGYRHTGSSATDGRRLIPHHATGITLAASESIDYRDRFRGAMVGTAIGDALGRPAEGLSPRTSVRSTGTSPISCRGEDGQAARPAP